MTRALRLLACTAALAAGGAVAAAGAAAPAVAPMHETIDITASGQDEAAMPSNFAVRAGGTVTLTFRNHTNAFHTFTIRALHISVLVRPSRSTSVTFVVPYGVYTWRCVICASGAHPHMHAMGGKMYAIVNA